MEKIKLLKAKRKVSKEEQVPLEIKDDHAEGDADKDEDYKETSGDADSANVHNALLDEGAKIHKDVKVFYVIQN